ncbi:g9731 [Coccomyxa elongata]
MLQAVDQAQHQADITSVESLELVRCLLRVSVFHTCYLRGIFPESSFKEVRMAGLDGMGIKMLIPGKNNQDAQRLLQWVEYGLHDAVGRQYLASMSFGVCQDAAQTELLEEFVYNFSYDTPDSLRMTDKHGNEVQLNVSSQGSQTNIKTVKYRIVRLMRTLIQVCTTLEQLPHERYVFMKLTYTDDTPTDYEPPYFRRLDDVDGSHFPSRPFVMSVGNVQTSYHGVSVMVRSMYDPLEDNSEIAKDEAEGQNSTIVDHVLLDTQKDCAASQKVAINIADVAGEKAIKGSAADLTSVLSDVKNFCTERQKSTVDFADVMATFNNTDINMLERCFQQLVMDGTLKTTEKKDTFMVCKKFQQQIKDQQHFQNFTGTLQQPLPELNGSQDAHMHDSHAGSERTLSTLLEAPGKPQLHAQAGNHQLQTAESPQMSFVYQGTQQSDQRGTKRKASCAEDPIHQHLQLAKPSSRLRLQKAQCRR